MAACEREDQPLPEEMPHKEEHLTLGASLRRAQRLIRRNEISQNPYLVEKDALKEAVTDTEERFAGCLQLAFGLFYFLALAILVLNTEGVQLRFTLEAPLREALESSFPNVVDIPSVWGYIENTFMPTFFKQTDLNNQSLPSEEWSRVFTYNQLITAAFFVQTRSVRQQCERAHVAHMECFPEGTVSDEPFGLPFADLPSTYNWSAVISSEDEGFTPSFGHTRRLREAREEWTSHLPQKDADAPHFKFFLLRSMPLDELMARIEYFRLRGWLDEQTTRLSMHAIVINAEIGRPRMESVNVDFAFSRGGGVFASARYQTLFIAPDVSFGSLIFPLFFAFMFITEVVIAVSQFRTHWRDGTWRAHVKKTTTQFVCANIVAGSVIVAARGYFLASLDKVQPVVQDAMADVDSSDTEALAEELHTVMDDVVSATSFFTLVYTYYCIFTMGRIFITLKTQPRLAVVVRTLEATSIDLAHFFVIFVPTFVAYAIAGMFVFGRRVDSFSTVEGAIGVCFKIAIENEFEWDEMSERNWWTAAIWAWSFVLLVCLIMLNMVLAIIMDVYSEVRIYGENAETVSFTLWFVWWRIWNRSVVVDHKEITKWLESAPEVVSDSDFDSAFPEMWEAQRCQLFDSARHKMTSAIKKETSNYSSVEAAAAIKLGLDGILVLLIKLREHHALEREAGKRPDELCIQDVLQSIEVQGRWTESIKSQFQLLGLQTGCLDDWDDDDENDVSSEWD